MLGPTQREEWKKKHFFRFFVEERLVELGTILVSVGYKLCDAVDCGMLWARKIKQFVIGLFWLSCLAIIMLFSMFW